MEPSEHDMYLNPISIGLLLLAIVTLWIYKRQGRAKLPPGPWHIPFIGNAWELTADPDLRKSLRRLHKQYGDIYRLYMGPKLALVISGYEAIKEVFVKRGGEFSDRPDTLITTLISEKQGIVSSSGELWKEHRKFTLTTLRKFGFGKTSLEGKIHTEVSILLSEIAKQQGKPFRIQHLVQTNVSNVINAMTFGGHFNHDDPRFAKMMKMMDENVENNGLITVVAFFPFLRYLPGDLFRVKKMLRNVKCLQGFIGQLIDKHVENFDESKMEDFIDAFLLEMKNNRDQKDSTFTKKQLIGTVLDLLGAGTETTTTTITWAVLYLTAKQDIQARVFREINEIVGTDRLPSLQDKRNLVYTEAFIMEVLRVCNIVPVSFPHTCTVDTKLRDFDIPKGTTLVPDIDSVLFDPKIWGDPEEFRPERFIDEKGILLKPDEFIPFFTGIIGASGELWKEHRKFTLTTLRNFGFGKTSLEGKIHTEVSLLLSEIAKQNEKPFRIQRLVQVSVSNVINAMTFGGHFKHDDPRFATIMTMLDENLENNGPKNVVSFFPFLRRLPGDLFRVKKTLRNVKCVEGFIGDLIDKHIENFDENKMEDFIDAFLLEMKNNRDQKDSTFTKKQLIKTVSDLFVAGSETTTTTITWAVLYLAAKQNIQARVFREINEIVGTDRLPSLQDKRNLVYTEAFVMEVLRICNIVTVSLPHTCSVDSKLRGFDIPKGTTLIPDIDSVLFDPKVWGDPEEFRPERFISEEGTLTKPEEFIPFFTGKRNCVGESLARMELDLFIPALVQRLEFLPPEGTTLDINEIDGVFGVTHKPRPFEIRAILRKK